MIAVGVQIVPQVMILQRTSEVKSHLNLTLRG